jgi:poly(3-hydroxybutyrate) depolymerase
MMVGRNVALHFALSMGVLCAAQGCHDYELLGINETASHPLDDAAGAAGQGAAPIGSPGCGKPAVSTGQLTGQTIAVDGQARTFALSVPADYSGTTPLALVIGWHGANVDGNLGRKIFNLEATGGGSALFVYPDALASAGPATWDTSPDGNDAHLASELVSLISSTYCIDRARIFAAGHSTGGAMTVALACSADWLRAIALVASTPGQLRADACVAHAGVWMAHGENDPLIPFSQGEALRDFWTAQNGCGAGAATWPAEPACVAYGGCLPDRPVVWCVHDEGHAWPNLTTDCNGGACFDAGVASWSFFSSFR